MKENFKLPLYHTTSSLFRDSILLYGLGGRNPIAELQVLLTLKQLVAFAKMKDWVGVKCPPLYEKMAAQVITPGANWQHGDVYLTTSKLVAHYHAGHRFGSELISETLKLYQELGSPDRFSQQDNSHPVLALLKQDVRPLFVTLRDIPLSELAGESGQEIEDYLRQKHFADCSELEAEEEQIAISFRLLSCRTVEASNFSKTLN